MSNDNDLTLWYFNVFDSSKIGYKTLESLTSRSEKFANVITTDGYAVSFMFKKAVAIQDESKREPNTPSISTIFTAVVSTEHERIRTTNLEEYYHLCGYSIATRRRKEYQECHLDEFKYISELPTLKTANLTSFLLAASIRLRSYQRIHNNYCQHKCIGLKSYSSRLISTSKKELKKLLKGSLTTVRNIAHQAHLALKPNPKQKQTCTSTSSPQKRTIAFGNGSFGSSMKGKRAAPTRRITEEIERKCKQSNGEPHLIMLTSTSQV
ncbi:uncharacterized protein RHIMIDRAFT_247188 [Rhizopus microsporus ATCC 52813]|uniref:Uncharacterized protein n=1 Tax=Rhizopus microsporus ATCC 52813 TaxID=1340429 RepID=A0A2G4T6S6_RHIZD|nr:uncharacterized protein RHIMIDRAFT_247188 [Rhizopus microsporus ATCC 52813]PHZ16699.1 hypothetical protein RHIMIDRAFT_247188 [Rhizopus microsporus ATCC 52813]